VKRPDGATQGGASGPARRVLISPDGGRHSTRAKRYLMTGDWIDAAEAEADRPW